MQFLQHSLCVCGGAHNLQYIRAHLEKCIIWTHSEEVKYRHHLDKYGFIQHMSHTDAYSWRVSYDRIQDSCSKWVRMKCIWCCMRTLTSYSEWCCMMSYDVCIWHVFGALLLIFFNICCLLTRGSHIFGVECQQQPFDPIDGPLLSSWPPSCLIYGGKVLRCNLATFLDLFCKRFSVSLAQLEHIIWCMSCMMSYECWMIHIANDVRMIRRMNDT